MVFEEEVISFASSSYVINIEEEEERRPVSSLSARPSCWPTSLLVARPGHQLVATQRLTVGGFVILITMMIIGMMMMIIMVIQIIIIIITIMAALFGTPCFGPLALLAIRRRAVALTDRARSLPHRGRPSCC